MAISGFWWFKAKISNLNSKKDTVIWIAAESIEKALDIAQEYCNDGESIRSIVDKSQEVFIQIREDE